MKKILLILLFSLSCSRHDEAECFLTKAQSVIETGHETSLMYLDSIIMPEKFLNKEKYMEYLVTKVQAKYKNYDNIKGDTNIFEAKDYFDKKAQRSTLNAQRSRLIAKNTRCTPISTAPVSMTKEANTKTL